MTAKARQHHRNRKPIPKTLNSVPNLAKIEYFSRSELSWNVQTGGV